MVNWISIIKGNAFISLRNRIKAIIVWRASHTLSTLLLLLCLQGCFEDDGGSYYTAPNRPFVRLRLGNDAGWDLLNPQTPGAMTRDSIVISGPTDIPADHPENFYDIYLSEDSIHYVMKIYISLEVMRGGQSLTGIRFGKDKEPDVIRARLFSFAGTFYVRGFWVNDVYIARPDSIFLLVK